MRGHGSRSAAALDTEGTRGRSSPPLVRIEILPKPLRAWPRRNGLSPLRCPDAPFSHLQRLTDNVGLLQHADGVVPLHTDGYSVDDVARGLLVVCREPSLPQELIVLGRRYLYFLVQAQELGGKFRNHLGYNRQWRSQPGTEDSWGCALWALGTAAARGPTTGIREESFMRFSRGARVSSPSAHAMAFAALGAAEILDSRPGHHAALALLYRARVAIGTPAVDAAGLGQRPVSATPARLSPRLSSCPATTSEMTGCSERDCACSSGCLPPRPGTATCP